MKKTNITKKTIATALAAITMTGTFGTIAYADNEITSPELEYTAKADEGINYQLDPAEENTAPVEETAIVTEEIPTVEETTPAAEETAPAEETPAVEETPAAEEIGHEALVDAAIEACKDISDYNGTAVITTNVTAIPGDLCCLSTNEEQKVIDTLIDLDNALIDDLADMLPMGNTLTKPLKWLTGWLSDENHEDDPDPIDELGNKIDAGFNNLDNKINNLGTMINDLYAELNSATTKINNKLNDISKQADVNAEWLRAMNDNSTRLTKCTSQLDELNSKATGISGMYYRISGIETDTGRTDLEKLVDLAALSHDPTMISLTEKLDVLSDSLYERTGALNTNFFDAVTIYNYKDVMFSTEAYDMSIDSVNVIVEQYITSAMLYLRTLEAENEIASFTKDELMQLGDEYIDLWNSVRKQGGSTITMRYDRVKQDIEKVLTGYTNYVNKSVNDVRYIDHGKTNISVKGSTRSNDQSNTTNLLSPEDKTRSTIDNIYKGNVMSQSEMLRIVDYAKTRYPETSFKEFMNGVGIDVGDAEHLLCSDNIKKESTFFMSRSADYYTDTIDMNTKGCKSSEIKLAHYENGTETSFWWQSSDFNNCNNTNPNNETYNYSFFVLEIQ